MRRLSRRLMFAGTVVAAAALLVQAAQALDLIPQVQQPARRIISLAPHLTELLYVAGAGEQVVATVEYSDFPPQAMRLPRVGNSANLDIERILAMKPDLVLAWSSGSSPATLDSLRAHGLHVEASDVARLTDIPVLIERIGELAGTSRAAVPAAGNFRARLRRLEVRYQIAPSVRVFYQVADLALYTLNRDHWINDALRACGARNLFADMPVLSGQVDVEAVVKADPQVIVASGEPVDWERWQHHWREWPAMTAVRGEHLYFLPPDLLHRPGPRLLEGVEQLCAAIDRARR